MCHYYLLLLSPSFHLMWLLEHSHSLYRFQAKKLEILALTNKRTHRKYRSIRLLWSPCISLKEGLIAEREVAGLIPWTGPILRVFNLEMTVLVLPRKQPDLRVLC